VVNGGGSISAGGLFTAANADAVYTDTVRATANDGGGPISGTATVTINNVAPTAEANGPYSGNEGSPIVFSGSGADANGDPMTYEWDFDYSGGFTVDATGATVTTTFTDDLSHTVAFRVTDDDDASAIDTASLTVNNVAPTAVISGPITQTAGLNAIFDASGSTDPGLDIASYDWDLDDDGQYDDASGVTTTVSWTAAAVYTVGLRVSDDDDANDTDQVTIAIEPGPLDHFTVSAPTSSTAGVAFTTVITAEDQYGNVITDWDQSVTLTTTNGGDINPTVALGSAFANGVWSGPVSLTGAGDGRNVTASHTGHTGQDTLRIEPAAATHFTFSTIGQQTAGAWSAAFSLTARDPYGNQDTNYDGEHALNWSGLATSPHDYEPVYPYGLASFVDGVASDFRFRPYAAGANVVLSVTADDDLSGASNPFTVTHSSAAIFSFSTIGNQVAGSPVTIGSLTVEDTYGNKVTSYTGTHTLSWGGLGTSPGGRGPDYPNPVNFTSGVASLLVFTPYLAESGARLTATEGSVSGQSNLFNVNVGSTVGQIVVESAPNSTGSEVTTHDMVVQNNFIVYAAGYDAWGNYIADRTVSWSGSGVALGRLSPTSGSSTTFTPVISGTAAILAQYSPTITDVTGLITVRAPVLEIAVSDHPDPVQGGATLVYTIIYSNTGNATATGLQLTANYDSRLTFQSASPSPGSGNNTWNLGSLPAGSGTRTVIIIMTTATLPPEAVLNSTFNLRSAEVGWVSDNQTTEAEAIDLRLGASYDNNIPYPGKWITYTLHYTNTGDVGATGVALTAPLPNGTTYVGQGWTYIGSGYYRHTVGDVGAGTNGSFPFVVRVNSTSDDRLPPGLNRLDAIFSIADDGGNGPEYYTSNNQAASSIGIPNLVIDQIRVEPATPSTDGPMTFTVVIRNQGTGWAWNPVNKSSFFLDLFLDPDPTPESYPCNNLGDRYATIAPLAPAQTREIVFVYESGLSSQSHVVCAKVDNYKNENFAPWQQNSLVPESDENNNVKCISVDPENYIFLPIVVRGH
jgi:uncharacterized repeat protein (TIGR01451 family)